MAKVYDVPADVLIERLADILKNEDIPAPSWAPFVKTGAHADKPPQDSEWWHTRCASIMRKIYFNGPIGVNESLSLDCSLFCPSYDGVTVGYFAKIPGMISFLISAIISVELVFFGSLISAET